MKGWIKMKEVNELIKVRKQRKKEQKVKRIISLVVILVVGLCIMNFKSLCPNQKDMEASANKMSGYIVAQYKNQGNNADLQKICKEAKKLDKTGLRLVVNDDNYGKVKINFVKDYDEPQLIKSLPLN